MDQNVEPLTPSRLGLARKFQLGGAFLGGLNIPGVPQKSFNFRAKLRRVGVNGSTI